MKNSTKEQIKLWTTFFLGGTLSFFTWLSWSKLTEWIGDSTTVWIITGVIVIVGIFLGFFSIKAIANRFSN